MDPRKRTHLVNELMQEANLMMAALEKAMEGERIEESHPALHGTQHTQRHYSLEDEHKAWGTILKALTDMKTKLEEIEHAEHQRTEAGVPSPYAYAGDGGDPEEYTRV
jgi:hypothetical protein